MGSVLYIGCSSKLCDLPNVVKLAREKFGGLLKDLNPAKVSNLDKAVLTAREFTAEVVAKLKSAGQVGKAT